MAADTVLTIFHAGSLSVPFGKLEAAFEEERPGVDVQRQIYGSAMAIRQLTELGKKGDLIASADYDLIDQMMIRSHPQWASWNLLFARNSICLALCPRSSGITSENWAEKILEPDVHVAMSNPNHDPCGYRALMTLYLAQKDLGKTNLVKDLILANSDIQMSGNETTATLSVPASASFRGKLVVRPKETDLIPLLQTGAADCLFIYRSIAEQQHFRFIELPSEINLQNLRLANRYGAISVCTNCDTPKAETIKGGPIVYGITIPDSAPNPDLALEFISLLTSEKGRDILQKSGQEPLPVISFSPASGAHRPVLPQVTK